MNPYNDVSTATGSALATTGVSLMAYAWWAVALVVVGGMLVTGAKLAPRVAVEPVRLEDDRKRLRVTYNGKYKK